MTPEQNAMLNSSLQQYLPFTVLKRGSMAQTAGIEFIELQQYLPFTVLKRTHLQYY